MGGVALARIVALQQPPIILALNIEHMSGVYVHMR